MKWLALATLVAAAGCAGAVAAPARTPGAPPNAETAYDVPPGGSVRVAVLGWRQIAPSRLGQGGFRALAVRLTLDNGGAEPWRVLPREQVARIVNYGPLLPVQNGPSEVIVPPGRAATVELLYPVPLPEYGPAVPRHVELEWRVHTPGGGVVARRANLDPQVAQLPRQAL
jgi:hypothetical protein